MNEKLIEPLKYYNEVLKDSHRKNVDDFFNELVKKSNVNVEENRQTVKQYKNKLDEITKSKSRIKKFSLLRTLIILTIVGFGIYLALKVYYFIQYKDLDTLSLILSICFLISIIVIVILLIKKINPTISNEKGVKEGLEKEANSLLDICYKQMEPLNRLYDSDDTRQLILKTFPDITLDRNFDMKRFEYLNGKYGLTDNDDVNVSSLKLLTGDIIGNPYVIVKNLFHYLGNQTYHGSLTIYWETYSTDSHGNRVVEHHSETLHASVTKPRPFYYENTTMIYGNEAAPNLSFSRTPSHVENLDERKLNKTIKKGMKEINKIAENSIKNGGNFTPLGNDEFDVIFKATNRDNETEFRLLFTPLAQKNMLDLFKNGLYGDDIKFVKENKINKITRESYSSWDLDTGRQRFVNYDIDDAYQKFALFEKQYFEHFYFQMAPILSIPLYQQHKPSEYIYKHNYSRNYTSYQTEVLANILGGQYFAHPNSQTQAIIKTKYNNNDGQTDNVVVNAYSYDTINRVDYIPVFGGDGNWHDVPVDWVEYIPLKQTSAMKLRDTNLSDLDFDELRRKDKFNEFMNSHSAHAYSFASGMFAMKVDDQELNKSADLEFNTLIKTILNK